VAEHARTQGYTFYVAPEIEYFYFSSANPTTGPVPLDRGGYFDLSVGDPASSLRRRSVTMLEEMGIPVEHAQHEDAPSQHEVDLRYTDVLTMADTVMTTRLVLKALASEEGLVASFMPKPLAAVQGSGMHTHCSLWRDEQNAFADPSDDAGLSETARQFMAGLLVHAPEITAITNQWVNSYKRLVAGHEAPVSIGWARSNRSSLVRVPVVKHGRLESTRLEYRAPDSACNPYLSFAMVLAAGLRGIEGGYELEAELTGSHGGARPLPSNLNDAVDLLENSSLARATLGDHVVEWFVRNKRAEWAAYKAEITQFELDRYLPTL
jgi:glutamine synthetase